MNETVKKVKDALNLLAAAVNEQLFDGCREWWWVGEKAGGICCFEDADFLNTEEMILILENNVTYEQYSEWRDYNLSGPARGINLDSWLRGCRPELVQFTKEDLMRQLKDVREKTEQIFKCLKAMQE